MPDKSITVSRAPKGLCATLTVPGDKSISHRVAILGALAEGSMDVQNFLCSEDCLNTLRAMQQLGAEVQWTAEGSTDFRLTGTAMQPQATKQDIDCGNSGTGMRLMAGLMAGLPFSTRLFGDHSLSSRPMKRIIDPLSLMGAQIEACGEKVGCAPLQITGAAMNPIHYDLPMASAQVKSAVLLAGLLAEGETSVHQPAITRDHTERLLAHFDVPCATSEDGLDVSVQGPVQIKAKNITIPADISSAAFWLVAASIVPGSDLCLKNVGLNPTRDAIIHVLKRMGADITITVSDADAKEPYGDIRVRYTGELVATEVYPAEVPNLIDEIPVLSVAAAFAKGTTKIRNAKELRVKESDRIATTAGNLRAMGGLVEEFEDGMEITGGAALHGAVLDSFGDHRIAMSFLMAGLCADGETTLLHCENINTSYPSFEAHLEQLTS